MKKMICLLGLLASVSSASAAGISCKENGASIDNGYRVYFSNNVSLAVLQQETIAGPRTLATLECFRTDAHPSAPDMAYTTLVCSEPNLRDAGYSLQVNQGGFAGLTTVTLGQITFTGATQIAELVCSSAN